MLSISIDHVIVFIFLITTLVIGLCASRNIKDIAEYAISNKILALPLFPWVPLYNNR